MVIILSIVLLHTGGLAVAVPGEVSGHYAAWRRFGRVPWPDLVIPTAELCEEGFVVEKSLASAIRQYETTIRNDTNFAYVHALRSCITLHYITLISI